MPNNTIIVAFPVGRFTCTMYAWKFAYQYVFCRPAGRQTEASAGERTMFMLHAVDATGHYILIILNRKITGDIIISNYRHYNYGSGIFITHCPPGV